MSMTCLQALTALAAGATPVAGDFAPAPCPAHPAAALRYDAAAAAPRAIRDIAAGETIAAPPASLFPDVRPGERLYLVARVGTATVEREVTAAQPGRRGHDLFVRTPDGRMVAAPLSEQAR